VKKVLLGIVGAVVAVLALSACGSQDGSMPDVRAKRLDIALSDIERAGFDDDVEVLGGGTFGIVDESNWDVCDQEPSAGDNVKAAPRLTVARACDEIDALDGPADDHAGDGAGDDASAEGSASEAPAPTKTPKPPKAAQAPEKFAMPALVGMNLQDAQDTLQAKGSYLLTQTDATGMERFQVLDAAWKVCYQQPAAGTKTSLDRMVELGAVKLDESCG